MPGAARFVPGRALVVLPGGGEGPTPFGVLLIAVCVVLLGASLLIRNNPVSLRMDVEDRAAAEVDALRSQLRCGDPLAEQYDWRGREDGGW